MKFTARILATLFAFILIFFVSKTVFAQTNFSYQQPNYYSSDIDSNVPNNMNTWVQTIMIQTGSALVCQMIGINPVNPKEPCLGVDVNTGKLGYQQTNGGVTTMITNMIGELYTPPVRVGGYFAYLSNNFGLVKPTYAQSSAESIGFQGLEPILGIWIIIRNIAYLLFILIFLIVGIAIMLRVHIDARTVMTIQNQIPKLVIGIILVTFSFAIAGFLINLMWVITYTVIATINQANMNGIATSMTTGVFGFTNYVFGGSSGGLLSIIFNGASMIGTYIQNIFRSAQLTSQITGSGSPTSTCGLNIFCSIAGFITGTLADIIGAVLGAILGIVATILSFIIIAIALIVQLLRLWFKLLICFITIIIDVIISPLWIIAGLIPGAGPSVGFTGWLRDIFANLMVFPAVVALFLLGNVIYYGFSIRGIQAFAPPLVGTVGSVGTTGAGSSLTPGVGALIALGIILMSPNIVDAVKKAFKASGVGTGGAMGGIAAGAAIGGTIGGAVMGRMYYRDQQGQLKGPLGNVVQKSTSRIVNNRVVRTVLRVNPTEGEKPKVTTTYNES